MNQLIEAIEKKVAGNYSKWKIGITEKGHMRDEGYCPSIYYDYTQQEVKEAFEYFTGKGMVAMPLEGLDPNYLYIFDTTGKRYRQ
jgi:hypothetical protein